MHSTTKTANGTPAPSKASRWTTHPEDALGYFDSLRAALDKMTATFVYVDGRPEGAVIESARELREEFAEAASEAKAFVDLARELREEFAEAASEAKAFVDLARDAMKEAHAKAGVE